MPLFRAKTSMLAEYEVQDEKNFACVSLSVIVNDDTP